MIVYHGSISRIEKPLASVGRDNLDFGKGFYVTDIRPQAINWAKRMAERKQKAPILNTYELDLDEIKTSYRHLRFEAYDSDWLNFIVSCRTGSTVWQGYDIIEGGVANDRVVDTIEAYMAGLMPIDFALGELSKHQPNNQICITSQNVINNCLVFKGGEPC